jgi:hypothetical protein
MIVIPSFLGGYKARGLKLLQVLDHLQEHGFSSH